MEQKLMDAEGIQNVFQRDSVKLKSRETLFRNLGVDNPSKHPDVKAKKKNSLKTTIAADPGLFKRNWHRAHEKFMGELGYDPRLLLGIQTGRYSKESALFFKPILDLLNERDIPYMFGEEGNRELCLRNRWSKKIYFYDFAIPSLKIAAEYNGVIWHANPEWDRSRKRKWKSFRKKETSSVNIRKYARKLKVAEKEGYRISVVWSDEDWPDQQSKIIELIENELRRDTSDKGQ